MYMKALAVSLGLLACAPMAWADRCAPSQTALAKSSYGLNYARLAEPAIASILSQGELEYIQSDILVASGTIRANQKRRLWRKHVRALLKAKLPEYRDNFSEPNIYFFRIGAPNMFQALRNCVDSDDHVLGYIAALPKYPATVSINN